MRRGAGEKKKIENARDGERTAASSLELETAAAPSRARGSERSEEPILSPPRRVVYRPSDCAAIVLQPEIGREGSPNGGVNQRCNIPREVFTDRRPRARRLRE